LLVALTIAWVAWAGWSLLGHSSPYTLRVIDDQGAPVASAVVDVGGRQVGTTDEEGLVEMEWSDSTSVIEVSAVGHISQMQTIAEPPEGAVEVVLNARVLRGRVVDEDGDPVDAAVVTAGEVSGVSDEEGHFAVRGAEPGTVTVARPAWVDVSFQWDGGPGDSMVELEHFIARAVHMTGEATGERLDEFIDMAHETELNALMIDLKDETGAVFYPSQNQIAVKSGAVDPLYDLTTVVEKGREADLYLIGRIVAFNDPMAATFKPDMAVWDSAVQGPLATGNQKFLDPSDPKARKYALDLAAEACSMGLDEIQFDYVRFPDNRPESSQFDGGSPTPEMRKKTINSFLAAAVKRLHPLGCAVAADVFGFVTAPSELFPDGGIGQYWEDVTALVDVISPMVYPSHYDPPAYGFDNPNAHPGPMVEYALEDGLERLKTSVIVRPWLQDFLYTEDQVRAQIEIAEKYGFGWMLWNAKSDVTESALDPE
jgi:hypothetical protein